LGLSYFQVCWSLSIDLYCHFLSSGSNLMFIQYIHFFSLTKFPNAIHGIVSIMYQVFISSHSLITLDRTVFILYTQFSHPSSKFSDNFISL